MGENKMKPQFTEEEARQIWEVGNRGGGFERFISTMKSEGYIRKSDLEILIEECDAMYDQQFVDKTTKFTTFEVKLFELVRLLKAELNKRREG